MSLTFRGWLQLQDDRPDVIGSLARDHARCRFSGWRSFLDHLADCGQPLDSAAVRSAGKVWHRWARRRGVTA